MLLMIFRLYKAILNILLLFLTIVLVPRVAQYLAVYIDKLLAYMVAILLSFLIAAAVVGAGFLLLITYETMRKLVKTLDDKKKNSN
ncbi:MAG: hypothetical protein AAF267_06485 [Deinococcota bacterium]